FFEAFVARENRRRVFIAAGEQLEEQHRSGARDRQIADFVDNHQAWKDEGAQPVRESPGALRLLERVQQIGECREVDAPAVFGGSDGETQREMGLADARWA